MKLKNNTILNCIIFIIYIFFVNNTCSNEKPEVFVQTGNDYSKDLYSIIFMDIRGRMVYRLQPLSKMLSEDGVCR